MIKNKKYDRKAFTQPLRNFGPDTIVIGFTGALGSGCTFLSTGLAQYHSYMHLSLSAPLHEEARLRRVKETLENLQKIGNEYRAKDGYGDVLVWMALREADEKWKNLNPKPSGIILDGIRNTNEVAALRLFRNFFLFSILAEEDLQTERLLESRRCKTENECKKAIKRDAEERLEFGQQINRCNDLADIVVINNKSIQKDSERMVRDYVQERLYDRYVSLIEVLASGNRRVHDYTPTIPETLMTAAYVESRRSKCLKRKVGAIIASPDGDIIAAGFNEVPGKSCWEDPDYGWCARDILQGKAGRKFLHCPHCGTKIKIDARCVECGRTIESFTKRCPGCNSDPEIDYLCPKCRTKVYKEYLAGGSPDTGKMLDLCRSLHAEENAILRLGKTGVSVPPDAQIYITAFPCNLCANKIVMTGIRKVIYTEPYTTKEAKKILKDNGVAADRFEGVKSTAYFRLYS